MGATRSLPQLHAHTHTYIYIYIRRERGGLDESKRPTTPLNKRSIRQKLPQDEIRGSDVQGLLKTHTMIIHDWFTDI